MMCELSHNKAVKKRKRNQPGGYCNSPHKTLEGY